MGHVEVILAFVLFMGFLVFALYFFNPLDVDRVVESSIAYAMDEISQNISVELITYSIVINDQISEGIVGIPIENPEGYNVRAENNAGDSLPSKYEGGHAVINRGSEKFILVKFSKIYNLGSVSQGTNLEEGQFTISSSDTKEVWSEAAALELNNSYYEAYNSVKEEFNLPGRVEFGFSFNILEGNSFISEMEIPADLEVWSESERKESINVDGESVFADLTVKVW